jgi:hypothetical protein
MQRDTLVFDIINKELERQRRGIELIASENFTSLQVIQASGNVMTNKYAEGYPGKRYYAGLRVCRSNLSNWRLTGLSRSLIASTPMYNPIAGHRQMPLLLLPCCNRAIEYWGSILVWVVTLPTAHR